MKQKTYEITYPDNHTEIIENLSEFCRNNNLKSKYMSMVARGERGSHKDFKVKILDHGNGVIPKSMRDISV